MRISHLLFTLLAVTVIGLGDARGEVVCGDGCNYLWTDYLDSPDGRRGRVVCDNRRTDDPWSIFPRENDHGIIAGG